MRHEDFIYDAHFNQQVNHFNLLCYTAIGGFVAIAASALVAYGLDYCCNRFSRNTPRPDVRVHTRAA